MNKILPENETDIPNFECHINKEQEQTLKEREEKNKWKNKNYL